MMRLHGCAKNAKGCKMSKFDTTRKALNAATSPRWEHVGKSWPGMRERLGKGTPWDKVKHYTTSEWFPVVFSGEEGRKRWDRAYSAFEANRGDDHNYAGLKAVNREVGEQGCRAFAQVKEADKAPCQLKEGDKFKDAKGQRVNVMRDSGAYWTTDGRKLGDSLWGSLATLVCRGFEKARIVDRAMDAPSKDTTEKGEIEK